MHKIGLIILKIAIQRGKILELKINVRNLASQTELINY